MTSERPAKRRKMATEDTSTVKTYSVAERFKGKSLVDGWSEYQRMYKESQDDNENFWDKMAKKKISWFREYNKVKSGTFKDGNVAWFLNGRLNVCYNCVDRHVEEGFGDQVAIIWEGNKPSEVTKVTYKELQMNVSRVANAMKRVGLGKGDTVCIYMPMVLEAAYAMLACARIGAIHSVVFAGFSATALADRINDASCSVLFTTDEGVRGDKAVPLKKTVDVALASCPTIKTVFVSKRTGNNINWVEGRDIWLSEAMKDERPYCPVEEMNSEDILFLLYTSGSTGKPKGVVHTQAGYLLYASTTHQYVFDYHPGDVYACVADIGWITGHSYIVYGPLANRATTLMFESTPLYPDPGRYWDMVQRHKINIFYTAPTAIRALMKYDSSIVEKYDLSTLRVLGTVGEPINPSAWEWYHKVVGKGNCSIVDTWWQTETGGIMITPLPGATPQKPGSATFPFFGVKAVVLDPQTGKELQGNDVKGVLAIAEPWPSVTRTVWGNHERYCNTYLNPYPGYFFSGDGCHRDKDGYIWIIGRVDDVLNVSGHRLGTAEIESALVAHETCSEAAVVGVPHEVKGQSVFAYCCLKEGVMQTENLEKQLRLNVRSLISPIAQPDKVVIVPGLPKTRSGKIMRRILRKIACNETDSLGDVSTLADPSVVQSLIDIVAPN